MYDQSLHRKLPLDSDGQGPQLFPRARVVSAGKSQHAANLVRLLLVQPQNDIEVFFKAANQIERAEDVFGGAFLRVRQVKEHFSAGLVGSGAELVKQA